MGKLKNFLLVCLFIFLSQSCVYQEKTLKNHIPSHTKSGNWDNWEGKIITYNIWGMAALSKYLGERINQISIELEKRKLDFVLLQEAWRDKDRELLIKNSKLKYSFYYSVPRTIGSGLFHLSKTPLTRSSFREFSLNGRLTDITEGDAYAGKGVGMSTISINNLPISFFSTHTIARYGDDHDQYSDRHTLDRLMQMFEIFQHIVEQTDSDAFVVAGDFNIRYFQEEYLFWKELTSLDGLNLEENNPNFCTYCPENVFVKKTEGQLDYIFISPRLEILDYKRDFDQTFKNSKGKMINFSDHYGLSATLKVNAFSKKISSKLAREKTKRSLEYLKEELDKNLLVAMAVEKIEAQESTKGVEDRICRSCRIKEALSTLTKYQSAIQHDDKNNTETNDFLKNRLDSYFNLFE